jgi:hypothetical protein
MLFSSIPFRKPSFGWKARTPAQQQDKNQLPFLLPMILEKFAIKKNNNYYIAKSISIP